GRLLLPGVEGVADDLVRARERAVHGVDEPGSRIELRVGGLRGQGGSGKEQRDHQEASGTHERTPRSELREAGYLAGSPTPRCAHPREGLGGGGKRSSGPTSCGSCV